MKTLYRASQVVTLASPTRGEWVLTDGRHVRRVGSGDPPGSDRVVDLPGATIVPGSIDAHVHLTSTGLSLVNREVEAVRSKGELLDLARSRALDGEGVVHLQGFDESRWDRAELPSATELEEVTERPLVIRRIDGHLALVNTVALEAAGASDADGYERDGDGAPRGAVTREANRRVSRWLAENLEPHRIEELQLEAAAEAAARGITCVHEMSMPMEAGVRDTEVLLAHRDRLPVDVVALIATTDIAWVLDLGLRAVGGDLATDGSIGARTAAVMAPYADGTTGATAFADDELAAFFHDGHAAGLQVGVHAIGDRAVEQVLVSWERVYRSLDSRERRHFRARRHRIEHVEMATSSQIERAAVLGLAACVQPAFDARWGTPGGLYEMALGTERAGAMNPLRTMLERGLVVGAGSDAPVTPLDPWGGIEAMRRHHDPGQRLSLDDAIGVSTLGGARLAHHDDKKGVLIPGAHADLAAYDEDPWATGDVSALRPILTVSRGREVFAT